MSSSCAAKLFRNATRLRVIIACLAVLLVVGCHRPASEVHLQVLPPGVPKGTVLSGDQDAVGFHIQALQDRAFLTTALSEPEIEELVSGQAESEDAAAWLTRQIDVRRIGEQGVIAIRFEGVRAADSLAIATAVGNAYVEVVARDRLLKRQEQLAALRKRLSELLDRRSKLRRDIASWTAASKKESPERRQRLESEKHRLQNKINAERTQHSRAQLRLRELETTYRADDEVLGESQPRPESDHVDGVNPLLAEIEKTRAEVAKSRKQIDADLEELGEVKGSLYERLFTGVDVEYWVEMRKPELERLDVECESYPLKIEQAEAEIATLETLIRVMPMNDAAGR